MNNFNVLYENITNELNLRDFTIICEDSDLFQVAKPLLNLLNKNADKSILILNISQIKQLVNLDKNWRFLNQFNLFLDNLNKFNKDFKLIFCYIEYDLQVYQKYLSKYFSNDQILQIFEQVNNDDGNIFSNTNNFTKILQDNCLIVINKDLIQKGNQLRNCIEHELGHFIQLTINLIGDKQYGKWEEKQIDWNNLNIQQSKLFKQFPYLNNVFDQITNSYEFEMRNKNLINCIKNMYFKYGKNKEKQFWINQYLLKEFDKDVDQNIQLLVYFEKHDYKIFINFLFVYMIKYFYVDRFQYIKDTIIDDF